MVRKAPEGDYRIRLPELHPGQRTVLAEAQRFNWLCAGRRWRKTTLCMRIAIQAAAREGRAIVWCAPTNKQLDICWNETQRACGVFAKYHVTDGVISFPEMSDGTITFRSMEEFDNHHGLTADGTIFDEAPYIDRRAWYRVTRPMLMDTGGWAWFIGTPNGDNWFAAEHRLAASGRRPNSAAWQSPSLGFEFVEGKLARKPHPLENPNLSFAELEDMLFGTDDEEGMTEREFREQVGAEFLGEVGGVFRNIALAAIAPWPILPYKGTFACGIDWGRTSDYTVITVMDVVRQVFVDCDRFVRTGSTMQINRIAAMYAKWGVCGGYAEQNGLGYEYCEKLRERGLPFSAVNTTNALKDAWVDYFADEVENRRILFPSTGPWEILRREMEIFREKKTATGMRSYGAPTGKKDDFVLSALFCAQAARTQKRMMPEAPPPEPFAPTVVPYGKAKHASKTDAFGWEKVIN